MSNRFIFLMGILFSRLPEFLHETQEYKALHLSSKELDELLFEMKTEMLKSAEPIC